MNGIRFLKQKFKYKDHLTHFKSILDKCKLIRTDDNDRYNTHLLYDYHLDDDFGRRIMDSSTIIFLSIEIVVRDRIDWLKTMYYKTKERDLYYNKPCMITFVVLPLQLYNKYILEHLDEIEYFENGFSIKGKEIFVTMGEEGELIENIFNLRCLCVNSPIESSSLARKVNHMVHGYHIYKYNDKIDFICKKLVSVLDMKYNATTYLYPEDAEMRMISQTKYGNKPTLPKALVYNNILDYICPCELLTLTIDNNRYIIVYNNLIPYDKYLHHIKRVNVPERIVNKEQYTRLLMSLLRSDLF